MHVGFGLESATAAFIGQAGVMPGSVGLESATAAFIGQVGVMPGSVGLLQFPVFLQSLANNGSWQVM